ncbi:fumarylacetoacetate hydrolase family protein [Variovorax sp. J22R133]|uniref:fumarylacetoacetate hydrolase family protein n=1 Tax=Variovorax brevis TaxID=3053503 RepID=UPI002574AFF0|nr:fumarylacetoacetate hydrolase family protein [Variovorax sp. J22R133]MDM0112286.1 fumarylacetoacetate hydrolase family protein [Variovorax sp. J22R133]
MTTTHAELAEFIADARRAGVRRSALAWADALQCEEEAYLVQDQIGAILGWFRAGEVQFWKSGGPSRFDGLSHARLPMQGVRPSGTGLSDITFHHPFAAAGIALRIARDVTPDIAARITAADAESLVNSMTVAIEISDSRWEEHWEAPALLQLADTNSHGALVLGEWQTYVRRDWKRQSCEVAVGASSVIFKGAYGLEDPAWLLPAWLRHATRNGLTVPAGSAVITGSWSGGTACKASPMVRVSFAGMGEVTTTL